MNTVIVENCKTLFIGRRGENEVTEVVFDFSEWQAEFGNGVIDLYVKRNLDVDAYPVVLSVDGTVATWLVTAADTDVVGNGKIEFVYTVNEKVAKSAVFPFFVGEDIGQASSEPPDPYESWIETLTELGTETQANAQAAAQSASDAAGSAASASESAGQAEDSAEDAEAWAVGERNGEPVSVGDETYENSAKYWAWKAKTDAPVTSVNGEAGDIVLDLDDIPNGETYARATPEQLAQIGENADDIADIDAMIPNTTSESNHLVNVSFLTNRLTSYRTSAAQDTIDAGKQDKINAYGILKRDRSGNITAAIAGADYVTADALNSYRKATAQDAIDNAQNQNINKNTAALSTMQPAATAADIGKALIVKTVADGKPTSYEYGEAGGGGSSLTAGDGIDIANDVISNTQGIEYIVGTQTAATSKWTGNSTDEELKVGKIIAYYLPYAGATTAATLALTMADGTTTREISLQYKPNATVTTQFPAGSIIILVYDGSYWRVNASYDTDTNTYPTGYCVTNGSVAAKAAVCSFGYRGDTNYFPCLFRYANTAADATLAITTYAPEAAPIYVNGARTSATNTFGPGVILFLYYNGAYYCYNDGRFPILVDGAVTSVQEYATGLLVNYRTAAAQDTIDSGKQAKITATGILKGDGAGGVSSAAAGTDYATPQQVNEKYAKPSGGIPSTDMTAAVQASLSKAESALQAVPDTYRTAADQDVIDNGKQAKITASGILKGDGAGGVSAAVAGVDYLKSAPVTSVNGQTGDVTIQTATDAQVTTAVNTWLGENVVQETGYVLDASLTMSNAAPPASAVGDLKSAFNADLVSRSWAPTISKGSYIGISDGKSHSSSKYARTAALWGGFGTLKAIAVNDPTYEFCLALYDGTGNLSGTGFIESLGYSTGIQYIPETAVKFGVSFRRVDQAALTDSDITAITEALSALAATDTTLSVAGAAADAKAAGDRLAENREIINTHSTQQYVSIEGAEIKNWYMANSDGHIISSSAAKFFYIPCIKNTLYRIDHAKSGRFIVGCFNVMPAIGAIPTTFELGTTANKNENSSFITTESDTLYLGVYYYSKSYSGGLSAEEVLDAISVYTNGVDATLKHEGIAADAKAVGDALSEKISEIPNGFYSAEDDIAAVTTFAEVIALYDGLLAFRPDYVTKNTLTHGSVTNYEYVFSTPDYNDNTGQRTRDSVIAKPTILMIAGIHGYERAAVMSLYGVMKSLCENDYSLKNVINFVNIKVIPVGCPWSFTNNSRVNANGVNINRNFATPTWHVMGEGTDDYSGATAGDQDETQIIQNWILANNDAIFYFDCHNSSYTEEISMLSGDDTGESRKAKLRYLYAINDVIPYWQKYRKIGPTNIYAYTGGEDAASSSGQISRYYASVVGGIDLSFTHEACWDIGATGRNGAFAIGTGREALGNLLSGMLHYYEDL